MNSSRNMLFAALAGSLLLSGACTDDSADSAILILQNQIPGEGCAISTAQTTDAYLAGQIDTRSTVGYLFNPIIKNYSVSSANASKTQRMVFLEGVDVEIDFQDSALFSDAEISALDADGVTRYSIPLTGIIEPDGGVLALSFEVVPTEVLEFIASKTSANTLIYARVAAYGKMSSGDIRTQTFSYPITVCTDCSTRDVGLCTGLPEGFVAAKANSCNAFQDGVTDCCGDGLGGLVCPAVRAEPTPTM